MTDDSATDPASARVAYRVGYREGFHDGLDEARRQKPAGDGSKEEPGDDKSKDGDDRKDEGDEQEKGEAGGKPPLYKRPLVVLIVLVVLLALIIAAIVFWRESRKHEKTDDAFVDGRAAAVAAQTAGRVSRLLVDDNQHVKAGDVLVEIDSRDNEARAAQARAQLANARGQYESAKAQVAVRQATAGQAAAAARQAQAESARADQDLARFDRVDPDAVPRQQADTARAQARSAKAQLDAARANEQSMRAQVVAAEAQVRTAQAGIEAAQAQVDAAELQIGYTKVVAPMDGRVTRRQVEAGNVISVGQPIMSIVGEKLWVTANYKETQLTRMRTGQAVDIQVDAFPDVHFKGHVDSIQRGTGAYFSMLPAENATGNYVKVTQRVPVKIVFDGDDIRNYAIGPGMSVTPSVDIP